MKSILKVAVLTSLFVLTSCAHHRNCSSCCGQQCDMKKEQCQMNKEQCPMKKDEKPAATTETKK